MAGHRIVAVESLHEGWGKLLMLRIELPDGHVLTREVEDHGAAVAVLPYDPDRRMAVLVRQFRAPVFHTAAQAELLEVPAGMLDEDDPQVCGRREAGEEAGLALRDLERVSTVWTIPGVSTEQMQLFLAPYAEADKIGDGGGLAEEHENITVVEMSLAELGAMTERGALADLKTLALAQALRLRRPELFEAEGSKAGEKS